MKTLTPKQRREIYLKVFIRISKPRYEPMNACQGLCYLVNAINGHESSRINEFPELELFEPSDKDAYGHNRWWEGGETGIQARQNCMLRLRHSTLRFLNFQQ